ncbi:hypothetical protein VV02_01885 [Luteipulveratus mongoliensis]|uniref:Condensation domain-containing protein n=2 Tax=Luteipulveratus mongoliensis TaxID=571913 RepID=A0A0K1JDX0_9MICO|nr:hypothetical protein VV02_01885 [Luteipulveratus mongoliensis]
MERRTLPEGHVDLVPHVLAERADATTAADVVTEHLAHWTAPLRWPSHAFVTIENLHGTTLIAAFDHGVFDGYSAYLSAAEILRSYAEPESLLESVASAVDVAEHERASEREGEAVSAGLDTWSQALDENRCLPALPVGSRVARDDRHPHRLVSIPIATAEQTSRFVAHLRALDASIGLGFIASLVAAILATGGGTRLDALMSVHNRDRPQLDTAVGWFAGVVPVSIQTDRSTYLLDVIDATQQAWDRAQPATRVPRHVAARELAADLRPALVLSYIHGRRCAGWERWAESDATVLFGPVDDSAEMHVWVSVVPGGTYLEVRYPDTPSCHRWVEQVADTMRSGLLDTANTFLPQSQGA